MNSSSNDRQPESTPEEVPTSATISAEEQQELPCTNGSDWGRKALKGITEMHQNEEVRKAVARRLF